MITLDRERCTKCGTCFSIGGGYCISSSEGYPQFDHSICNLCQKCVAVCPSQAIMVNSVHPDKITAEVEIATDQLEAFLQRRRSTKRFKDVPIPRADLERIISAAKYAPNQNKNIDIHVVTDSDMITQINEAALGSVRFFYRLLFGFRPLTWFLTLFARGLVTIRRKMIRDLEGARSVLKPNTQAVVVLTGDKRVPVTAHSAPYLMASMFSMAEAMGVGACLMDSVLLALRINRRLRKRLGITRNVLCAMVLGYSDEPIVNIPRGYEPRVIWNDGGLPGRSS